MNSPFESGALCHPISVEATFRFRGDMVKVTRHGWQCEATEEVFSTPEQEDALLAAMQEAWRQLHHIPTPAALQALRKQYGLSARDFSKLLGMGQNQYTRYENGELPTRSKAVLLAMVATPEGLRLLLQQRATALKPQKAAKLQALIQQEATADLEVCSTGVLVRKPYIRANAEARNGLINTSSQELETASYELMPEVEEVNGY